MPIIYAEAKDRIKKFSHKLEEIRIKRAQNPIIGLFNAPYKLEADFALEKNFCYSFILLYVIMRRQSAMLSGNALFLKLHSLCKMCSCVFTANHDNIEHDFFSHYKMLIFFLYNFVPRSWFGND